MNTQRPVNLTPSGPPETVLPEPDGNVARLLDQAAAAAPAEKRAVVVEAIRADPRSGHAWAALGALGEDAVARYAAFRVGYHRGLDQLRQNGWRGSGYVRWAHASNRGFLACLEGLRAAAADIGETDEEERCALFLRQLDPEWPPAGSSG